MHKIYTFAFLIAELLNSELKLTNKAPHTAIENSQAPVALGCFFLPRPRRGC